MQNWNDGKSQEYKDRKTYCPENAVNGQPTGKAKAEKTAVAVEETARPMLFVTKTCPNCRIVKPLLDKAGVVYDVVDAEENPELAAKYGLKQAPTLVADGKIYAGVAEIKEFMK